MPWYALFNKDTKHFIGFSASEMIKRGNILIRELEGVKELDIGMYRWDGDYESGSLKAKIDVAAVVKETEIEKKYIGKLMKKYPLHKQLKIIIDQISFCIQDGMATREFVDLKKYIDIISESHQKRIQYFKDSEKHEFYSKDKAEKDFENAFKTT